MIMQVGIVVTTLTCIWEVLVLNAGREPAIQTEDFMVSLRPSRQMTG
jgi:hypothetical protein